MCVCARIVHVFMGVVEHERCIVHIHCKFTVLALYLFLKEILLSLVEESNNVSLSQKSI